MQKLGTFQDLLPYVRAAIATLVIAAIAAGLGYVLYRILNRALTVWAKRTKARIDDSILIHCRRPLRVIVPLLAVMFASPSFELSGPAQDMVRHALSVGLIISIAWLSYRIVVIIREWILMQYDIEAKSSLEARRVYTQIEVFENVLNFIIAIVAIASVLTTFERVRNIGVSLLASAGIAGIIIGFAAQRTLGTFLAGIQIAITQPIRIDDVVIVENEWGRVEEITLTYVIVRIWDLRRLIVPINYFIEKPFENWTRTSADLLGTILFYTDYTIDVEQVRRELNRIVKTSERWDGKVCVLQVTNVTDRGVELRALVSATDSSVLWDLRCEVREKLLAFIQRSFPDSLPRVRAELPKSAQQSA